MNGMKITLIQTAPVHPPGSMRAYGDLVEQSVHAFSHASVPLDRMIFYSPADGASMWAHHRWRIRHARRLFARCDGLFHLLDGSMAAFVPRKYWSRLLVTVHDFIPLRQWQGRLAGAKPSGPARLIIRRSREVIRQCRGICAVSECTRRDVERFAGRRDVTVIPHAVRPLQESNGVYAWPPSFILHIGNNAAYKNRIGAARIFSELKRAGDFNNLQLLMAGPPPDPALLDETRQRADIQFVVDANDYEVASLYRRAQLLLFPSLFEGYGMPVIEAMAAGCPVVCSSAEALLELAGDAALTADAHDTGQLAALCRQVLQDKPLRDDLINRGRRRASCFYPEKMGEMLCEWYHRQR